MNKNIRIENQRRLLSLEASRALGEADTRHRIKKKKKEDKEIGGRGGKDPARYGDWEIKGRAIDF